MSLRLKPLTIIVGPNSSGKSNCLDALDLLNRMLLANEAPPKKYVKDNQWVGAPTGNMKGIRFQLQFQTDESQVDYSVLLNPEGRTSVFAQELLRVDGQTVIDVSRGKGNVTNEDGTQRVPFSGSQLAIKSAGSYGNKPVTNKIANHIRSWRFYDTDPEYIRHERRSILNDESSLDLKGGALFSRLSKWASDDPLILEEINAALKAFGDTELEQATKRGTFRLKEGEFSSLPLDFASDGTLRLLFYYTLPYQPDLPALIGIEEPERNLHPGVLVKVSQLLESLSRKSQVVITTHSSQLLDCFSPASIGSDIAVILLHKKGEQGTQAISLEDIQASREALRDWMSDFGVGNAIFQSQLLQDIIGN